MYLFPFSRTDSKGKDMNKILKILVQIICIFLILIPATVFSAGNKADTCDTRHPVILAHGTGGADKILGIVDYWWGISDALENEGAEVFITRVDGMGGTEEKAEQFRDEFLKIQTMCPPETKFNIIGHSHGALYTRFAISNLGLSPHVSSLTSIAGPHRGMVLADRIVKNFPNPLKSITGTTLDFLYAYFMGDSNPDSAKNVYDVTTLYMKYVFNPGTPNMGGVYYQSWAAKVKYGCPNIVLDPVWRLLAEAEGPNDGLVSVESAKWGNFCGEESGAWWSPGCDHLNIIGHLFGITPGFYAPDFYVNLVANLKNQGF